MAKNTKSKVVVLDARKQVLELAKDSSRVIFTTHVEQRMEERGITRQQVLRCLHHGRLIEGPAPDIHGHTKMTLESISAGDPLHVAAALQRKANGGLVVIITAYYA